MFYYKVMPFGLKKHQGHIPEDDYRNIWSNPRENVIKCAFRVNLENILRSFVIRQGIKKNPEWKTTISNLVSPRTANEDQKLIGMAAALNRFINKSSDKYHPFFKLFLKIHFFMKWGVRACTPTILKVHNWTTTSFHARWKRVALHLPCYI